MAGDATRQEGAAQSKSAAQPDSAGQGDATASIDPLSLVMGVAFATMWSSAFSSARIVVANAPPFLALCVRFAIAGALGCALAYLLGQRARLTPTQWRLAAVFGVCQNALYLGLYFFAMTRIEAGLAAILASLLPLAVAGAQTALFGERLPLLGAFGLALGVAGVLTIMLDRLSGGADPLGVALCLLGLAALTVATLTVRGMSAGGDNLLMLVGLQMLIGAVALAPISWAMEESWADVSWNLPLALSFTYTLFIPGLAATLTWFALVRRIGPVRAATFHFLNPFLAVAIAAIVLGEAFGWLDVIGVAVIMGGILAVQLSRRPG